MPTRRIPALMLALALMGGVASGQTPPIPTPAPAPATPLPKAVVTSDHPEPVLPGVLVTLDAEGSTGDDIDWDTESDEKVYRVDSGKGKVYFASPDPGVYRFTLESIANVDGKFKRAKAKVAITVKSPDPSPPPAPAPDPLRPPVKPDPVFAPGSPGEIGQSYGKALSAAAASALKAASESMASDAQSLIGESRKAFDAGLRRAVTPMEADMVRRFGSAKGGFDAARMPEVKTYLNDVATGILGGSN